MNNRRSFNVSAEISTHQSIDVEEYSKAEFTLIDGSAGTADVSWSIAVPSRAYLEIYGEDGTALLDGEGISYKFKTWGDWKRIPNPGNAKAVFARQTNHFVEAMIGQSHLILGKRGRFEITN